VAGFFIIMARLTFGEIIQQSKDICIDDQSTTFTGMTDSLTFIKREINNSVSDIFTLLKEYRLEPPPKTVPTKANTKYYSYPPGLMKPESFTINLNTIVPPLKIVQSQQEWDRLQTISLTSGYPTHVFPRRDDFGVYPTPNAVYTITIVGSYQPVRMTVDDYTTGVVAVVNDDETISTTGSILTSSMVDSWFALTDSTSLIPKGNWYRLASFTDSSHMELSRTFTDLSAQGQTFKIGQSPELPEELHQYIAYKVGSVYWHTRRGDSNRAQELANYFYTGDFNNSKRSGRITGGAIQVLNDLKTMGRGNSNLIETGGSQVSTNYIENTPWNTTLQNS
jgi:hypothetical protein